MNLRQLRYLMALKDEGSASRAARALNISQPALSQSLHNLEVELGVELMRREGRKLVLTEAGSAALTAASRVMAAIQEVYGAVEGHRSGRQLKVAVTHSMASMFSAQLARTLKRDDSLRYSFLDVAASTLPSSLLEGRADVGFGDISKTPSLFETIRVGTAELVLASPPGLLLPSTIQVAHLAELPMVVPLPSADRAEMFEAFFEMANIKPRIAVQTNDQLALLEMARAGVGSMLIWKHMAAYVSGLEIRSIDPPRQYAVGFVHLPNPSADVLHFIDSCADVISV